MNVERSGRLFGILLAAVLLAGLAVRLPKLDEAPRDFWTVRQYNTLLLARAFYFENNAAIPEWQQAVARANLGSVQRAEPPVMERVGAWVFGRIGHEAYWPLRLQAVLAWVIAAAFLYVLTRRLVGREAALAATAFFLFLPYGFTASRSLQPDSLLVMSLLAALWLIVRHDAEPSAGNWWMAAIVSGLAIAVKPGVTQFTICGVYAALALQRQGLRKTLAAWPLYLFCAVAAAPSALYLLAERLAGRGFSVLLRDNFDLRLFATFYFWRGWAGILLGMFGLGGLLLALAGLLAVPRGKAFAWVCGFSAGYAAECALSPATTASHDYWHLQIVPLAALGIGGIAGLIWPVVGQPPAAGPKKTAALLVGAAWMVLGLALGPMRPAKADEGSDYTRMAREIGDAVGHSTNCVYLDYNVGVSLRYFGMLDGWYWPETGLMRFHQAVGMHDGMDDPSLPAGERYRRSYAAHTPDYFIVARALQELDLQPGLRDFLGAYPVVAKGDQFVIYDLRKERRP